MPLPTRQSPATRVLCVAIFACFMLAGTISSTALADDPPGLVAYFIDWQATAKGQRLIQPFNAPEQDERLVASLKGAAITRYREVAGRLA